MTARRRLVARAMLGVLLGMLTTSGVACAIACSVRLPKGLATFHAELIDLGDVNLWITEVRGVGVVMYGWRVETGGFIYDGTWEQTGPVPPRIPQWTGLRDRKKPYANDPVEVLGAGWPMPACSASVQTKRYVQTGQDFAANKPEPAGGDVFIVKGGLGIEWPQPRFAADDPRSVGLVFPLTPIWPGFLVNTVVCATPWLLLLFAPHFVRCRLRRRGLCPRCGYSRAGLAPDAPCPECGAAATPAP